MPTVIVVAVLVVIVALAVRSLIKQKKSGGGTKDFADVLHDDAPLT